MGKDRLEILIDKVIGFRDSRGWKQSDKPEYLAKSIIIEAAELLENFQWGESSFNEDNVKEELADVIIYSIAMAYDLGYDVEEIVYEKLKINAFKYPMKK